MAITHFASATDEKGFQEALTCKYRLMHGVSAYPTPSEVEQSLKRFAEEVGDSTESPFRVDVVARYGDKPPVYTVMIRCAEKEPIRSKLGQVLNRSFSLGGSSFALNASEAQVILQYPQKPHPASDSQ